VSGAYFSSSTLICRTVGVIRSGRDKLKSRSRIKDSQAISIQTSLKLDLSLKTIGLKPSLDGQMITQLGLYAALLQTAGNNCHHLALTMHILIYHPKFTPGRLMPFKGFLTPRRDLYCSVYNRNAIKI
jgi:hypothetical protein